MTQKETREMPFINENKQRWIDALRSGEYPQARGTLCREEVDEESPDRVIRIGYCCLGVAEALRTGNARPFGNLPDPALADWLGVELPSNWNRNDSDEWEPFLRIPVIPPEELAHILGEPISERTDLVQLSELAKRREGVGMAALNDKYHLSFPQIANLLEHYDLLET